MRSESGTIGHKVAGDEATLMNDLRILLLEGDEKRATALTSVLASANHSTVPVTNVEEATEALFIQRFDLVLLGSGEPADRLAGFVADLRTFEISQRAASRTPVFACSPDIAHHAAVDGCLQNDFDPLTLPQDVQLLSHGLEATPGVDHAEPIDLPIFEPTAFADQCAHDVSLMMEIIDLFNQERERDLSLMGESLGAGDFESLSRSAHTMKGSLAALHAPRARLRAQRLETAAKECRGVLSIAELNALELDLNDLAKLLMAFRQAC